MKVPTVTIKQDSTGKTKKVNQKEWQEDLGLGGRFNGWSLVAERHNDTAPLEINSTEDQGTGDEESGDEESGDEESGDEPSPLEQVEAAEAAEADFVDSDEVIDDGDDPAVEEEE